MAFLLCALQTCIDPGMPFHSWSRSMAFLLCAIKTFINPGIPCHSWSRSLAFILCALQSCIDPGMPFHSWSRSMALLLCALQTFTNPGIPCHSWSRSLAFIMCDLKTRLAGIWLFYNPVLIPKSGQMGRISPDIWPGYPVFKVPETWADPGAGVSCILWLKLAFRW